MKENIFLFFLDRWAIWLLRWLPAIVFVLYCICISLYYLLEITLLLLPQPPTHWWRKRGHNITWDHFYEHESSLNPARINDYIHYIVWGEVTYPFPNFNGAAGPSYSVGWNYLSIPKLKRCCRWSLVMDKLFLLTLYRVCDYLSMLGLKLILVSRKTPEHISVRWGKHARRGINIS